MAITDSVTAAIHQRSSRRFKGKPVMESDAFDRSPVGARRSVTFGPFEDAPTDNPFSATPAPAALTWLVWHQLQRHDVEAQELELAEPDDYRTDEDREELHAQHCPLCARLGRWYRDGRTVTFTACGHDFPVPDKPQQTRTSDNARRPRGTAALLMDDDERTGRITFEDGTLLAVRQLMLTQFPERGQYGEERWQITTTVANGSYVPEGTVAIRRVEILTRPRSVPFSLTKAIVAVADAEAPRPVITIQWRPNDKRDIEAAATPLSRPA
ncbi:hypothetical protein [Streptomyces niveus]|uniref:hypothetical protein n=1 Tax=Streptomyces niveus TaxID=193462 RepID=UPI0034174E29